MLAERNNITLQIDVKKSNIPNLHIDLLLIQEVIENLIANAIAYSTPSGKVDIIVDASENTVSIAVKDTGIGISKEDQKKLFTKFFRSEKAKIKNTEGSGLGLYVVKSYVERWGGKMNVESEEGKGSIFTILLPIKAGAKQNVIPKKRMSSSGSCLPAGRVTRGSMIELDSRTTRVLASAKRRLRGNDRRGNDKYGGGDRL
jgi:signal transduction histidine kinase